ncbi:xanthine/CO dehydrogenase XdhC/CoxF family maturation factor [Neisseria sp. HSC-16F19]|nr:cytochrome C [Neisseria sp. HSC-16F19]MCP2041262.1 xanthine/CO dehydrogenase XdhC/CoxF family maturation factor [Neisseria sp. HSC-16F19]
MTFKPALTLAAVAAALALAACSDKQETSVQLSASEAAASSPAAAQAQTLASSDGKISITVDNGRFEDRSAEAAQWLGSAEQGELVLLQRDDAANITLAAHKLGQPKSDAAAFFNNLAADLKANQDLQDVEVGEATDNRMNYRFSHSSEGVSLSEQCVALYEAEQLYSVCASSDSAPAAQLAAVLGNITLKP